MHRPPSIRMSSSPSLSPLLLFFIFLLLLPHLNHAQSRPRTFCSNRGAFDVMTRRCLCIPGFEGSSCQYTTCPTGYSWLSPPHANDLAHAPNEICSGAGDCNWETGVCTCSFQFDGPACNLLKCPIGVRNSTTAEKASCSGHGRCLSIREASNEYSGIGDSSYSSDRTFRGLTNLPTSYDKWDADQIQGCVCDRGYAGHNCGLKTCPFGDDFPERKDAYGVQAHNEIMRMECIADAGNFIFAYDGSFVVIEHDAPIGMVKKKIESMNSIGRITITMTGATVCAANAPAILTTIFFDDQTGKLYPAKLIAQANLKTGGSAPVLNMVTRYVVTCPTMPSATPEHFGGLNLIYNEFTTNFIDFTATAAEVQTSLQNYALIHPDVGQLGTIVISVTSTGAAICSDSAPVDTTIEFRGQYGNVRDLTILDTLEFATNLLSNFTLNSPRATTIASQCSNRGKCDYSVGVCDCNFDITKQGFLIYQKYGSSDGLITNGKGNVGNCANKVLENFRCKGTFFDLDDDPLDKETRLVCSGKGYCNNATATCVCSQGTSGSACELFTCPSGRSWFDTPSGDGIAHKSESICSGAGFCRETTGDCICDEGFEGINCGKLACGDKFNQGCGEAGVCLPMWELGLTATTNGESTPFTYGSKTQTLRNARDTWDRDMIQACKCDGGDRLSEVQLGPIDTFISGSFTNKEYSSGYYGYGCHKTYCPFGDDPFTAGVDEEQKITCVLTSGTFTLTFRDEVTADITWDATAIDVMTALSNLRTIRSVTVEYETGAVACVGAGTNGISIKFDGEGGNLPMIRGTPAVSLTIIQVVAGTRGHEECSGRGLCESDPDAEFGGVCECEFDYTSSDGKGGGGGGGGGPGGRRDCGKYDRFLAARGMFGQ